MIHKLFGCCLSIGLWTGVVAAASPAEVSRTHFDQHGPAILAEFAELLKIPNVASDLPGVTANARWIEQAFEARGAEIEVVSQEGVPPVVWGRLPAPGATRTLGIYVHYDGQPVDPSQWSQSPWEPTLYTRSLEDGGKPRAFPAAGDSIDPEWRIYGRGTSDDRAPLIAWLAAIDALKAAGIERKANLVFLFEGEEEAGSDHLDVYMEQLGDRLRADLWLIFDGPAHQTRRPQLVFGVRGYTGIDITVYGAARYLHSGHYGNWAPNPGLRLAHLLASCKDAEGDVQIEGWNVGGKPPVTDWKNPPGFEAGLREELGVARSEGDNAPYFERMQLPSFNVRGMQAAGVGDKARNVIATEATASIDIRLVEGNDPHEMLDLVEAHVRKQGYHVLHREPTAEERRKHPLIAKVVRRPGYRAVRTSAEQPLTRWLIETVKGFQPDLVLTPTLGGSLPLYLFEDRLKAPIVIVPIANHDNNQHAPDENLRLGNLVYGIELAATLVAAD
ncbi:hypothetical protein ABI59_09915 [Acidobacteria bacterium Mor1]|nr:hypothetical protein ABI59_09915 [Acidobacteria bacterium Mor1]